MMTALRAAWRRLSPWHAPSDRENAEIALMEAEQARAMRRIQARLAALGIEADVLGRQAGGADGKPD